MHRKSNRKPLRVLEHRFKNRIIFWHEMAILHQCRSKRKINFLAQKQNEDFSQLIIIIAGKEEKTRATHARGKLRPACQDWGRGLPGCGVAYSINKCTSFFQCSMAGLSDLERSPDQGAMTPKQVCSLCKAHVVVVQPAIELLGLHGNHCAIQLKDQVQILSSLEEGS